MPLAAARAEALTVALTAPEPLVAIRVRVSVRVRVTSFDVTGRQKGVLSVHYIRVRGRYR